MTATWLPGPPTATWKRPARPATGAGPPTGRCGGDRPAATPARTTAVPRIRELRVLTAGPSRATAYTPANGAPPAGASGPQTAPSPAGYRFSRPVGSSGKQIAAPQPA